ncbi:MAG: sigma 54-interacting transcriptional regulator [Pirellulaceae bacterium]
MSQNTAQPYSTHQEIKRLEEALPGSSSLILNARRQIQRFAQANGNVFVVGETGTGKSLAAKLIHELSPRGEGRHIEIDCASGSAGAVEHLIFGSGTGSLHCQPKGGTVVLDRIGEMRTDLQARLLQILCDPTSDDGRLDFRLICTNTGLLNEAIKLGQFRDDLYFRINQLLLELPPLRLRREDIPCIASAFTRPSWSVEQEALGALVAYDWPGNVRELRNVVGRAKTLADDNVIRRRDLPEFVCTSTREVHREVGTDIDFDLASIERAHVVDVLRRTEGNMTRSARALGIDRRKLYRLVEKFRISPDEYRR